MSKRLFIALSLLFFLSTYKLKTDVQFNNLFKLEEIIIHNNINLNIKNDILNNLTFLYEKNLLLISTKEISKALKNIELVESFEIKKIYPNKIKIKIFEKKLIAIVQDKKEKFYITEKGGLINFTNLEQLEKLPLVFGGKYNFKNLYDNLMNMNFPLDTIQTFYYFESNRWDLVTKNNQTIKLPIKNFEESLKSYMNLKKQGNFEKYKIFDYRIKDQLILK